VATSSILFIKKKEGVSRLCIDYQKLNPGTIKDQSPLQLITETLPQLSKAKYISKIDICDAFSLIRVRDQDDSMTAICTHYGFFESLVIPFGLTNAPATFQRYVNMTLRLYLNVFCPSYLEDILIYSQTLEEYMQHVRQILGLLQQAGQHVKP
jgi:hypothetical protein